MMTRIIAASVLSLGLGTAAFAQEGPTSPAPGPGAEVGGAPEATSIENDNTFATENDAMAQWELLDAEQQAEVRAYCDTVDTAAAGGMTTDQDNSDQVAREGEDSTRTGIPTDGQTTASVDAQMDLSTEAAVFANAETCGWVANW